MKSITRIRLFLLLLIIPHVHALANENVRFSGFGSIVAGQVIEGYAHVADYPNLGIYDDKLDLGVESKLGLQATAELNEKFTATVQAMSRAVNDFDPKFEWMFVNYAMNENLDIQAGKLRLPVYYYSEFMDLGIAYPWVRVPSDAYSLDLTNFNGIQLNHRKILGDASLTTTLFGGRQNNVNDPLMSYLFPQQINREFTDLGGLGLELNFESTILKATYTQAEMKQERFGSSGGAFDGTSYEDISFIDVFFQQGFGDFNLIAEYNEYEPFYKSYFASTTYTMGKNTFYLLYSKFELDEPFEEHNTIAIGLRHNVSHRVALKLDFSSLTDDGFNPFTNQPNPVNQAPDGDGDVQIISASIDFTF